MFAYLNLKISKTPHLPGVYFFKNRKGKILYIGKAADLRNRLRSYFSKSNQNARTLNMLKLASKVDWRETGSEIEALILESQLIKKHKPQFNILMRDDKQYSYVIFTKDDFPKIRITHQPFSRQSSADTALFDNAAMSASLPLGPFTDSSSLRTVLKELRRIFPYCTCKEKHNNYCLNYHLENCPGYCCLKENHPAPSLSADHHSEKGRAWSGTRNLKDYKKNINSIKDILSGKKTSVVKKLEKEMKEAARKEEFTKAIGLRNKIRQLNWVFENAKVIRQMEEQNEALKELQEVFDLPVLPKRIEAYDISHIQETDAVGSMVVFTDGKPDKSEYRKFKLLNSDPLNFKLLNLKPRISIQIGGDAAMLKEILTRRFRHQEWPMPDLIIVDGGKAQLNAVLESLNLKSLNSDVQTKIIALTKNKKHRPEKVSTLSKDSPWTIDKLPRNIQNLLTSINSEAHRFAISYHRKLRKKLDK